ncbi:MAG: hypothetical protein Q4E78_02555, partial [Eubacteriales bacterium]|nr:hypothetical protein [Eubacteriales bacterium]
MSKSQEQMKELIDAIRSGQSDKETLCKAIQKDVNNLIYPVFGEDYKRISPRAIIDICMNLDSINVDKNIMRQIATRVSVYMFGLIDDSTIRIDDKCVYEYNRIKEDEELFGIVKDNSKMFKDFKAYDTVSDNIKSLSRVQTIMMELYGYEMHSIDEIQSLLNTDRDTISKLIGMMKNNMLGIASEDEDVLEYGAFDEENAEAEAESEADDEIAVIEPENIIIQDNITDSESEEEIEEGPQSGNTEELPLEESADIDVKESDDDEEGVTLEYEEEDYNDAPMYYERAGRKRTFIDRLVDMTGRILPETSRGARRNIIYAVMVMVPVVIVIIISIIAMSGGGNKSDKKVSSTEYTTRAQKETTTNKESSSAATSGTEVTTESTSTQHETTQAATQRATAASNRRTEAAADNNQISNNTSDNSGDINTDKPAGGDNDTEDTDKPAGGDNDT